jgi:peptide/nickel transport system permease protein
MERTNIQLTETPATDVEEAAILQVSARRFPPFLRHTSLLVGLALVGIILLGVIGAPLWTHYDPVAADPNIPMQAPTHAHPFGTDQFGRDIFSRVLYGGRWTILGSVIAMLIATVVGTWLGLIAGYFGGVLDLVIMRVIDLLLAFPGILLALAIATIMGPGLVGVIIAIGVASIPGYGRVVQGVTLRARELMYVDAARVMGASSFSILLRHILPNVFSQVVVLATTGLGVATLSVAALGFLGLGLQPPTPEWGAILNDGRDYVTLAWWIALFPGAAITLYVTAVNLIGDGIAEQIDPTLKR